VHAMPPLVTYVLEPGDVGPRAVPQTMPLVTYAVEPGDVPVGVLTLDDGKMNSFDFEGICAFNAALDEAEKDSTKALVITGTSKAFSAGFDLKIMAPVLGKGGSREDALELVEQGGRLMMRAFGFPKPVVLSVTGHALALGAILLCAGDVRLAKRGAKLKVGMNETSIGMLLPEFGWKLGRYRLRNTEFTRACTQGVVYGPEGAAAVGYIDELVEDGEVLPAAIAEARRLGSYVKQPAFANMKNAERSGLIAEVLDNIKANTSECFPESWKPPSKL